MSIANQGPTSRAASQCRWNSLLVNKYFLKVFFEILKSMNKDLWNLVIFPQGQISCWRQIYGYLKRGKVTYTCIHFPFRPLPAKLSHIIEQNSLCYTVGPCWLSILNTAGCAWPPRLLNMCICGWVPLLLTWNCHNIVNWLYRNAKLKIQKEKMKIKRGKGEGCYFYNRGISEVNAGVDVGFGRTSYRKWGLSWALKG